MLSSIQPFVVPWVHHTLVSNERSTRPTCTCFHTSLYILRLSFQFAYLFVEPFICIIQPSVARSTVPLVVLPSISPNTTSFTSLLSSTLQIFPNEFNFLSLIRCSLWYAVVWSGVDGGGRRPVTSLCEMIHFVRFMYICDLADVWRSLTSYDVSPLLYVGLDCVTASTNYWQKWLFN